MNSKEYFEIYYTNVPSTPEGNWIKKMEHYFYHTPPYMIVGEAFKWGTMVVAIGVPLGLLLYHLFNN